MLAVVEAERMDFRRHRQSFHGVKAGRYGGVEQVRVDLRLTQLLQQLML